MLPLLLKAGSSMLSKKKADKPVPLNKLVEKESQDAVESPSPSQKLLPTSNIVSFIPKDLEPGESVPKGKSKNETTRAKLIRLRKKVVKIERLLGRRSRFVNSRRQKNQDEQELRDRKRKESKAERRKKDSGPLGAVKKRTKGIFDSILGGIGLVFLGWVLNTILEFKEVFKQLKESFEQVSAALGPILMPILDAIKFVKVEGIKLIAKGLGVDTDEKDTVLQQLNEIDKKIPIIDALFAAMVAMELFNALGGRGGGRGRGRGRGRGANTPDSPGGRGFRGVTESGGRRTGFRGVLDRMGEPFRPKPGVTQSGGRRTGFRGVTDRVRELFTPGGSSQVTTSGGRRTGFGGFLDRLGEPFRRRPRVTGGPSFLDRARGFGEGVLDLGRKGVKKLEQGAGFVLEQGSRFGRFVTDQYKRVTTGLSDWAKKNSPKLSSVLDWLSEQKGVLGNFAKKAQPVVKKLGKYLPFIGDALGFGMDLIGGVDWRRALIRMITGIGIDAGFTALMSALGVAAPFTGGASGLLATAIYAAYMGTDMAAGGFGRILGDKISDAFGLPMMAGEKPLAEPKPAGTDADIKKLNEKMEKKLEEDPEFAERVGKKSPTPVKPEPESKPKPSTTPETKSVQPQASLVPTLSASAAKGSELDLFKRLVYAEAGGEGLLGMALVARSVMNRAGLIQSGKATTGTFLAKDKTITGVIMGRNQYQPVRDGSISAQRSASQMEQAHKAIELASDPEKLKQQLKSAGVSDEEITKLMAATGFRTGSAFNDPSQNVNVTKFKNHYFNTAGNPDLKPSISDAPRPGDNTGSNLTPPAPPIERSGGPNAGGISHSAPYDSPMSGSGSGGGGGGSGDTSNVFPVVSMGGSKGQRRSGGGGFSSNISRLHISEAMLKTELQVFLYRQG